MKILYLPNSYSQQRQFQKKANIYPVLMAMEAEWYRKKGYDVGWGYPDGIIGQYDKIISEPEGLPFLELPHPDRKFTRAMDYTSGNYKYLPGTHIMSSNTCWWKKCTFCIEREEPRYELREVDDVLEEIRECKSLGYREIFDDSGTFPTGRWLDEFLNRMYRFNRNIVLGCNMRLIDAPYDNMFRAGFRMLLYGVESASQKTLDKINKGVRCEDIKYIIKAAKAGLEPHVAVIFGWEWETDTEALNTLQLVHSLLRKGYAKTAQASFIYQQDIKGNESQRHFIRDIYGIWKSPQFWFNKIKDIHNTDDLKYLWRQIKAGINGVQ